LCSTAELFTALPMTQRDDQCLDDAPRSGHREVSSQLVASSIADCHHDLSCHPRMEEAMKAAMGK
jgi:hypothetical protein